MTLLGREPRSVYRVYAEDEYFDAENRSPELEGHRPTPTVGAPQEPLPARTRPNARALTVGGLIATVAGLALAPILATGRGSDRRTTAAPAPALRSQTTGETRRRRPPQPRPHRPGATVGRRRATRTRATRSRALGTPAALPARRSAVAVSAPQPRPALRPDPQLEFGFER